VEVVTRVPEFDGYALDVPDDWLVEDTGQALLLLVPTEGPFVSNLVLLTAPRAVRGAAEGVEAIAGSVLLWTGPADDPWDGEQVVFGYPTATAALTAVRVSTAAPGAPTLDITFSADAEHFAAHWESARAAIGSLRRAP
jgi:hypothetical protein